MMTIMMMMMIVVVVVVVVVPGVSVGMGDMVLPYVYSE